LNIVERSLSEVRIMGKWSLSQRSESVDQVRDGANDVEQKVKSMVEICEFVNQD